MPLLDVSLIEYFSVIFPALLVFVIAYAIFQKYKVAGESKAVHAVIAISIAFLVMLSDDIIQLISFIAPWFVFVFIFLVLLLTIYMMMGIKESDLAQELKEDPTIPWTIFVIGLIIIGAGVAKVFGPRLLPLTAENATATEGSEFGAAVGNVLFHPKMIGLVFVFAVAVFTIGLLTKQKV